MLKPVQNAIEQLEGIKTDINKSFRGSDLAYSLPELNQKIDSILMRLNYMTGALATEKKSPEINQFPPITNFMGTKIDRRKPVTKDDINPKEAEKQKFREQVKLLYSQIRTMTPAAVMNSYSIREHITIVRGVARLAGVKDYEDTDMSVKFIEDIQFAIQEKEDQESQMNKVKKSAEKPASKILTKEDIEADKDLQQMNAKAGDELLTYADGRKELKTQKK